MLTRTASRCHQTSRSSHSNLRRCLLPGSSLTAASTGTTTTTTQAVQDHPFNLASSKISPVSSAAPRDIMLTVATRFSTTIPMATIASLTILNRKNYVLRIIGSPRKRFILKNRKSNKKEWSEKFLMGFGCQCLAESLPARSSASSTSS